jgi:RNA polymerase sigma factor (sigma-70 family)
MKLAPPPGYGQQLPFDVEKATAILAKAGDRRAIDTLVRAHLHHADKLASFLAGRSGGDADELRSQAYLGILEALKRYEPERNLRFLTYAVHWMRAFMTHWLVRSKSVIRPPSKAIHRGRWSASDASLDVPRGDGDETWLNGLSSESAGPEEAFLGGEKGREDSRKAAIFLRCLDERERRIVRLRIMAESEDAPTLAEVGAEGMGISRERVRQLEERALRKMRAIRGAVRGE